MLESPKHIVPLSFCLVLMRTLIDDKASFITQSPGTCSVTEKIQGAVVITACVLELRPLMSASFCL
jgi:hypothetical protein